MGKGEKKSPLPVLAACGSIAESVVTAVAGVGCDRADADRMTRRGVCERRNTRLVRIGDLLRRVAGSLAHADLPAAAQNQTHT